MKKLWAVVAGVAVGMGGVCAGQTGAKADSSASLRNDNARGGGQAAQKRAMTFADLMAMKRVSDPQISPSGKWVMFSVADVSLEKNTKVNHLWVVPMDGGTKAGPSASPQDDNAKGGSGVERQVTANTGESFGRFSPDGKFVSYTGEATKDDPVARITIATWDEATGTVGVGRTLLAVSGDADGAVWSPDSKHFLFTTEVWPECSVKGKAEKQVLRSAQDDNSEGREGGTREMAAGKADSSAALRNDKQNTAVSVEFEAATWAEEDACDKAKDEAAAKSPVKGEVWEGLLYRHWDHYTGAKRTHVIEADFSLAGANPRDLTPASAVGDAETPTFSLGGPLGYAWAPDGKEIAYVTNLDAVPAASTNNDVFTLRLDELGAKAVKVSTSLGSDDGPAYSPDGKWLAWRSQKQAGFESDKFRLIKMDRSTGKLVDVMPDFDEWIDSFVWSHNSKFFYITAPYGGQEQILTGPWHDNGNAAGAGDEKTSLAFDQAGGRGQGEMGEMQLSSDGSYLIATQMYVDQPAEVVAGPAGYCDNPDLECINTGTLGFRHLTRMNARLLSHLAFDSLEPFWFTGAEGTRVEGFLLKPPGFDPAKKYPVKFLMHGGPQTAWGDSWSYRWNWELMAASGYVVIGINRRGSTGYGQKFVDEVSGDWGGRAYVDLMRGLDYAEAHYSFIDKTRECALGASYGGYMADWVLTHTDRFRCIVTHDGMFDPVSAYGSTEEMWFNEWEFRRPEDFPKGWDGFEPTHRDSATMNGAPGLRGGVKADSSAALRNDKQAGEGHPAEPWRYASLPAEEDPFRKWSPMRFIENAKTPTLVIHSQKDYRLDVSQGFELFTALQRLGVPSKMLYFPDEGHWVLKPQNSELWYETVGDWCDKWTHSGKYAEIGAGR